MYAREGLEAQCSLVQQTHATQPPVQSCPPYLEKHITMHASKEVNQSSRRVPLAECCSMCVHLPQAGAAVPSVTSARGGSCRQGLWLTARRQHAGSTAHAACAAPAEPRRSGPPASAPQASTLLPAVAVRVRVACVVRITAAVRPDHSPARRAQIHACTVQQKHAGRRRVQTKPFHLTPSPDAHAEIARTSVGASSRRSNIVSALSTEVPLTGHITPLQCAPPAQAKTRQTSRAACPTHRRASSVARATARFTPLQCAPPARAATRPTPAAR